MNFYQFLLSAVVLLVINYPEFASSEVSSPLSPQNQNQRFLRDASADTEERGILSDVKSIIQAHWWSFTGKSEASVKKALNLENLSDDALKANRKYKTYQLYLYRVEGSEMNNWVSKKILPSTVWSDFGLNGMSAAARKASPQLKSYTRYVKKYDSMVYSGGYKFEEPKTPEQWNILVKVWAQADRPDSYVMKRLGINTVAGTFYPSTFHSHVMYEIPESEIRNTQTTITLRNSKS